MRLFHLCFLAIILQLSIYCSAQNLVPNWNFEAFNACPSNMVSMPYTANYSNFPTTVNWTTPVKLTTPDYLNDCASSSSGLSVPNSIFGYQQARSGVAYSGIIAFQGQFSNGTLLYDYREYIQTQLLQPLIAGKQYCVSFFVSPTISSNFTLNYLAIDELGINFSVNRPVDTINRVLTLPYHIKNTPGNFFTDTSKWYKISGTYTAAGGEKWLTLGSFFNGNVPNFIPVFPSVPSSGFGSWNYLFIDDVSVIPMTAADTIYRSYDTMVCKVSGLQKNFSGAANAISYQWQDGSSSMNLLAIDTGTYWCISRLDCGIVVDTFHIRYTPYHQLSLGNDSFNCTGESITVTSNYPYNTYTWNTGANTPSIIVTQSGQYILTVTDTCGVQRDTVNLHIQQPTPPPATRDTMICQFASAPMLNVEGTNLTWYYPNSSTGFPQQPYLLTDVTGSHTFYVSQKIGNCESPKVPIKITVKYKPTADIGDYYPLCAGEDTLLGNYYPDVTYLWNTGERSCCIRPRKTGTYELIVSNECGSASDTAFVEIHPCDECLFVPTAFTPNGDNRNDRFAPIIKCPVYNYRLRIYNRWGELIFQTNEPGDAWSGNNRADKADMGVYAYILEYNSVNTRSRKMLQGNITLIR